MAEDWFLCCCAGDSKILGYIPATEDSDIPGGGSFNATLRSCPTVGGTAIRPCGIIDFPGGGGFTVVGFPWGIIFFYETDISAGGGSSSTNYSAKYELARPVPGVEYFGSRYDVNYNDSFYPNVYKPDGVVVSGRMYYYAPTLTGAVTGENEDIFLPGIPEYYLTGNNYAAVLSSGSDRRYYWTGENVDGNPSVCLPTDIIPLDVYYVYPLVADTVNDSSSDGSEDPPHDVLVCCGTCISEYSSSSTVNTTVGTYGVPGLRIDGGTFVGFFSISGGFSGTIQWPPDIGDSGNANALSYYSSTSSSFTTNSSHGHVLSEPPGTDEMPYVPAIFEGYYGRQGWDRDYGPFGDYPPCVGVRPEPDCNECGGV